MCTHDSLSNLSCARVCSDKLLDVSLMRLAKYVWGQAGDSQGRLAALPPSLVAHLAERSVSGFLLSETFYSVSTKKCPLPITTTLKKILSYEQTVYKMVNILGSKRAALWRTVVWLTQVRAK